MIDNSMEEAAATRWMNQGLSDSLNSWRDLASRSSERLRLLHRGALRFKQSKVAESFFTWRETARALAEAERIARDNRRGMHRAAKNWSNQEIATAWRRWSDVSAGYKS